MKFFIFLFAMVLVSCGPQDGPGDADFIPFARDFEGYTQWTQFDLGNGAEGSLHPGAARRLFINNWPQDASKGFSKGTMIVKEIDAIDTEEAKIFTMAKQGGEFNSAGAKGWRFSELTHTQTGALFIKWEGFSPTSGYKTASGEVLQCNSCHAHAGQTDSILSSKLQVQ